jgi:replicative superfamily II helicase
MGMVRLLLIDEIHLVKEQSRGATLEVIVSRMKSVAAEMQALAIANPVRLVAVSATVPNLNDISAWLQNSDGSPAQMRIFGEEYRPIQLQKVVLSYPSSSSPNPFAFETSLDYKLLDVITKYSTGKPTLVFCSTRKSTVAAAERLCSLCSVVSGRHPFLRTNQIVQALNSAKSQLSDRKLADYVGQGVAFHHGGTNLSDRRVVESLFLRGILSVICTTTTLAVGVNLPAHLVVIKGTSQWIGGRLQPYSDMDLQQMIGRAGRPQV